MKTILLLLSIVHTVHGCHTFQLGARSLGAAPALSVKAGTRVQIRVSCPMDFTVTELTGPPVALGDPTWHTGTQHTLRFAAKGVYVLRLVNVQSSADMGLQTLGPDNVLTLTVRVR